MSEKIFLIVIFLACGLPTLSYCRFYIGPDVFFRDYHEKCQSQAKSDEHGFLYGVQLGYSYERPNFIHFGGDIKISEGKTTYKGSIQTPTGLLKSFDDSHTSNSLFNIEGRLGITAAIRPFSFTPFAGIGYQKWKREFQNKKVGYNEIYDWYYLTYGFRCYVGGSLFTLGVHYKLIQTKSPDLKIKDAFPWPLELKLKNKPHFEIEIPLSFNIFIFDLRLVPYFAKQKIGKSQTIERENYRISEPPSKTIIIGTKLELGTKF